jgi:hypothetical protein
LIIGFVRRGRKGPRALCRRTICRRTLCRRTLSSLKKSRRPTSRKAKDIACLRVARQQNTYVVLAVRDSWRRRPPVRDKRCPGKRRDTEKSGRLRDSGVIIEAEKRRRLVLLSRNRKT